MNEKELIGRLIGHMKMMTIYFNNLFLEEEIGRRQ